MCLLYRTRSSRAEIARIFQTNRLEGPEELEKDYVSPGRPGWVISSDGLLTARPFCRPHWQTTKQAIGNIRNLESQWWRTYLEGTPHRCLVPVTQFSEWPDHTPPGHKRRPVWFAHPDYADFAFAGIFSDTWFAFLTTAPNAEVGAIHKKTMPVILLSKQAQQKWLAGIPASRLQRTLPDGSLTVFDD